MKVAKKIIIVSGLIVGNLTFLNEAFTQSSCSSVLTCPDGRIIRCVGSSNCYGISGNYVVCDDTYTQCMYA